MANLRKSYALDTYLVEQGEWVDVRDGIRIKVRSLRSEAVKAARLSVQRKYEKLLPAQKWRYTPKQEDEIQTAVVIAALVGWEGVEDDNGPVPFSPQVAREYLTDPTLQVFREEVLAASGIDDAFRKELTEEIAGN